MGKVSLKVRVIAICLALNIMQIINGGLGIYEMGRFNHKFQALSATRLPTMSALADMRYSLMRGRML